MSAPEARRALRRLRRAVKNRAALITLLVTCSPIADVQGQVPGPVDSLVTEFLQRGVLTQWGPHKLYDGCPDLSPEQRRGIARLMSADLSFQRINDLAFSWALPLEHCQDPALERWYFDTMSRMIREDRWGSTRGLATILARTSTPAVQSYLRSTMLDPGMPQDARSWAGVHLIEQLPLAAVRDEWQRVFTTAGIPSPVIAFATRRLLDEDAPRLVEEFAQRIRHDPDVTHTQRYQTIFTRLFTTAAPEHRETVARAVEDVTPRVPQEQREAVRALAAWMRKGKEGHR